MKIADEKKTFCDWVVRYRIRWLLLIASVGVIADQTTKIWAQTTLAEPYPVVVENIVNNQPEQVTKEIYYPIKVVEVIPQFFNLIYKENPAAAFSLTHSLPDWFRKPLLVSISIAATLFFLIWYLRMRAHDGMLLLSFSLILTGAIGNLLDRIRLGYVIDFLDVYAGIFGYSYLHWPTFNIADSFIVVGACGVIIRTIWPLKESSDKPLENHKNSQFKSTI